MDTTAKLHAYLIMAAVCFFAQGCSDRYTNPQQWFSETKSVITNQSNLSADSVTYTYNEDSTFKREYRFSHGHLFQEAGFNISGGGYTTNYSQNGKFELRREICKNGHQAFEGIFYKGKAFGISTWYHCNGKMREIGIRFNGKQTGIWRTWDSVGQIIDVKDHKDGEPKNWPDISSLARADN